MRESHRWLSLGIMLCLIIPLTISYQPKQIPQINVKASSPPMTPKTSSTMLNIVCSIAMEGDWVNNLLIGTNFANVTSIITGNEDPHTYEAKPSDTTALINANWFIFFNNTELEPFWVPG